MIFLKLFNLSIKNNKMNYSKIKLIVSGIALFALSACNNDANESNQSLKDTVGLKTTEIEAGWDGCMVSAYIFQEDGRHLPENSIDKIVEFEQLVDHKIGSVMWYPTFSENFPIEQCNKMSKLGLIPHLTWELFFPDSVAYNTMPIEDKYKLMDEVLAGKHDQYIETFAKDAKSFNSKVLIRFLHEFNGNWYLWGGNKNGREKGGPKKVVAVWKYVVDKFRAVGANNVKWIWNPHGPSVDVSEEEWNNIAEYWPGDDYVDWIGMDAYNWYPKDPWGGERPFRDFDNCFRKLYDECSKLGDQPIMIAEFGTPEFDYEGQTKADWIKDALSKMKNEYPRIKMFVWFHINKELDWRINSSPEALYTFKEAMKDTFYIGRSN